MNYFKKMALILALVAGLCGGAWAQNRGHHDADRHGDRHWGYRDHEYRNGRWGYFPHRAWEGYYPYGNYGYYPYDSYGYYPYGAYSYYPNGNYGYYPYGTYHPYRNWRAWGHYPNRAWDHGRGGWHGGVRDHGHDRR